MVDISNILENLMDEYIITGLYMLGVYYGVVLGYIIWGPNTSTKESFMDGLTLGLYKKVNK